jgi:glutathione peroxidase
MRHFFFLVLTLIASNLFSQTIYDYKVETLTGETFDFASLKGKKIMIVNTASECGYTPQYADLEKLYEQYKDKGFVVVGFPANNFGQQEPGSNKEISAFCQKNYDIKFPVMAKISVKGDDMHELYKFLTQQAKNGVSDSEVKWNFQKYLIDENGKLVKHLGSRINPMSEEITNWIESN